MFARLPLGSTPKVIHSLVEGYIAPVLYITLATLRVMEETFCLTQAPIPGPQSSRFAIAPKLSSVVIDTVLDCSNLVYGFLRGPGL